MLSGSQASDLSGNQSITELGSAVVYPNIANPVKPFLATLTLVTFFACVDPHVPLQTAVEAKFQVAMSTLVRLFTRVDSGVSPQAT